MYLYKVQNFKNQLWLKQKMTSQLAQVKIVNTMYLLTKNKLRDMYNQVTHSVLENLQILQIVGNFNILILVA